jgi:hypothetical protein
MVQRGQTTYDGGFEFATEWFGRGCWAQNAITTCYEQYTVSANVEARLSFEYTPATVPAPIPEPSTMLLTAISLTFPLLLLRHRRA